MSTRDNLLSDIERFLILTGDKASEFGELAISDRGLVGRLRSGGDVTTATADKIRAYMLKKLQKIERTPRPKLRREAAA